MLTNQDWDNTQKKHKFEYITIIEKGGNRKFAPSVSTKQNRNFILNSPFNDYFYYLLIEDFKL